MDARRSPNSILLDFGKAHGARKSLSAVDTIDRTLWLAVDEKAALHRLVSTADGFGEHRSYSLAKYFRLPAGRDGEVDLEGLGVDREKQRLWIVGSHSLGRRQPEDGDSAGKAAAKLGARLHRDPNRHLLGFVQLVSDADGMLAPDPDPRSSAALQFDLHGSALVDMLSRDRLIAPFLPLPSKDNGLDIEGLAVDGRRVFLGLRGPVLRGTAIVMQFEFRRSKQDRRRLKATPTAEGRLYLRHLLDLDGLGVRDLCIVDRHLMILAGPTMALPGPMRLYRWRDALDVTMTDPSDQRPTLEYLFDLPGDGDDDHAEGIARWGETDLLVVYDKPSEARLIGDHAVKADIFEL